MAELEQQLGALLNDPKTMERIMEFAQSLNGPSEPPPDTPPPGDRPSQPELAMLQKLSALAGQGRIDPQQRNLLSALQPYVGQQRIQKLERAMQGAKMAALAGIFLNKPSAGR